MALNVAKNDKSWFRFDLSVLSLSSQHLNGAGTIEGFSSCYFGRRDEVNGWYIFGLLLF